MAIHGDVSNPDDVARPFLETVNVFGTVGVVVDNAGIMRLSPITSGAALWPSPAACLWKGSCACSPNQLRSVTVNAVAPGPIATELFLDGKPDEQITPLGEVAPLEQLGTVEDIADVVSFLCGTRGGRVNARMLRAKAVFA